MRVSATFIFLIVIVAFSVKGQNDTKAADQPIKQNSLGITKDLLEMYAGEYMPKKEDTHLSPMSIVMKNGEIFKYIASNMNCKLNAITDKKFVYSDASKRSIEFVLNSYGIVTHLRLKRGDGVFIFEKVKHI